MAVVNTSEQFQDFGVKFKKIFDKVIPQHMRHTQSIRIGGNNESPAYGCDTSYKISDSVKAGACYMNMDSLFTKAPVQSYWAEKNKENFVNFVGGQSVQDSLNKEAVELMAKGFSEEAASKMVKDSLKDKVSYRMQYDGSTGNYNVVATVKDGVNVTDANLFNFAQVLPFDVAWMNRIFKQPFVGSKAEALVSDDAFGNPWADMVAVVTEGFEGFGRLSNVAIGNMETNASSPVGNKWGIIATNIVNLSVEYESSLAEELRAQQKGNWVTGQGIGHREQYADFMLKQMFNYLTYFGDTTADFTGLLQAAGAATSHTAGQSFTQIMADAGTTNKGSKIVQAFLAIIGDFLQGLKYIPTDAVKVNVSTQVFKALTSVTFSDEFSADLPITVLQNQGKAFSEVNLGGATKVRIDITVDPMLDASTVAQPNPYNSQNYDYMFISVPSIKDDLGSDQKNLIIRPNLLDKYIIPPQFSRNGVLYTMYKRVGGVIAPIEGTVKVITGVGYQQ